MIVTTDGEEYMAGTGEREWHAEWLECDLLGMIGSGSPAALAVRENRGCWGMVILV